MQIGRVTKGGRNRAKSGDVIEIILEDGQFAYVQFLGGAHLLSWVRVLPGHFAERPPEPEFERLVAGQESYRVATNLPQTLTSYASIVGNYPVPDDSWECPVVRTRSNRARWSIDDSQGHYSADEFATLHPEIDQSELPWNSGASAGLLRHALSIDWHPRDAVDSRHEYPWSGTSPG